jgi:hypothetical protein
MCNFVAQISLTPDGRALGNALFSGFVNFNEQKFIEWLATGTSQRWVLRTERLGHVLRGASGLGLLWTVPGITFKNLGRVDCIGQCRFTKQQPPAS